MELRPIQAVLLAGRCASRRTTTAPSRLSYSIAPAVHRCVSSTRPSFSEAEAEATKPASTPSMTEWSRQQQQQQQQQQQPQRQSQPRLWGNSTANNSTNTNHATFGLASLLPANSSASQPSSPSTAASTPPPPSSDRQRLPWATPSSPAMRRSKVKRDAAPQSLGILETLRDLNLAGPNREDLLNTPIYGLESESAADIKYRLRPSIGRTVHLTNKLDLARGLGMLNARVRGNKVSQDFNKQRYHERPGLKRKRLRGERWRVRFKDGFKATCSRVQELARQGW